jgi:hypothetical protein
MALKQKRLAGGEAQYSTKKLYHIVRELPIKISGVGEVDWGFLHRDHGEHRGRRENATVELIEGGRP